MVIVVNAPVPGVALPMAAACKPPVTVFANVAGPLVLNVVNVAEPGATFPIVLA